MPLAAHRLGTLCEAPMYGKSYSLHMLHAEAETQVISNLLKVTEKNNGDDDDGDNFGPEDSSLMQFE